MQKHTGPAIVDIVTIYTELYSLIGHIVTDSGAILETIPNEAMRIALECSVGT